MLLPYQPLLARELTFPFPPLLEEETRGVLLPFPPLSEENGVQGPYLVPDGCLLAVSSVTPSDSSSLVTRMRQRRRDPEARDSGGRGNGAMLAFLQID